MLDTGDAVITECNGKDRYWGTGVYMSNPLSESVDNCPGKNKLGKLLMEARTILPQTPGRLDFIKDNQLQLLCINRESHFHLFYSEIDQHFVGIR